MELVDGGSRSKPCVVRGLSDFVMAFEYFAQIQVGLLANRCLDKLLACT
jgi:hypothetical protein